MAGAGELDRSMGRGNGIVVPSSMHAHVRAALERARTYLVDRQCADGGFCYYRSDYIEESNLGDTYHAVAALALLGVAPPRRDDIVSFIVDSQSYGVSFRFQAAMALDLLGAGFQVDVDDAMHLPPGGVEGASGEELSLWLEEALQTVLLRQRSGTVGDHTDLADFLCSLGRDGGYGRHPNLKDTFLAVRILTALGKTDCLAATRRFVGELQVPGLGFTSSREAFATSLETLRAGVGCCGLLDVDVGYPADSLAFVLSCQSRDGAFGREPVSLPDIELTHQAIEIMALLAPEDFGRV
jgi:hypothetical protein